LEGYTFTQPETDELHFSTPVGSLEADRNPGPLQEKSKSCRPRKIPHREESKMKALVDTNWLARLGRFERSTYGLEVVNLFQRYQLHSGVDALNHG
jgi:hypothetical protein